MPQWNNIESKTDLGKVSNQKQFEIELNRRLRYYLSRISAESNNLNVYPKTGSGNLGSNESGLVICDSASAITLTLPPATGKNGLTFSITNINTGVVTIDGSGSEEIQGDLTFDLYQDENIQLTAYGGNWYVS